MSATGGGRHVRTGEREAALGPHCVVTRIDFRRRRDYWVGLYLFFRLRRLGMSRIDGIIMSEILTNYRECRLTFVSLWPSQYELVSFTSLDEHVRAARWSFRVGATVWSGVFQLLGQSSMSVDFLGVQPQWRPAITDWSDLRSRSATGRR